MAAVLTLLASATGRAQQLAAPWVACDRAEEGQTVWFARQYVEPSAPRWAMLTVAATGWVQVRVNGRPVAPLARMPHREAGDTTARALTFDVSPLVRPDTNTVVVWTSPSTFDRTERQLSLCFYGEDSEGRRFARVADGSWLCRPASTALTDDGGELADAASGPTPWTTTQPAVALWVPAQEQRGALPYACSRRRGEPAGETIKTTLRPRYFDLEGDTVVYDFGPGFWGFVRLTLRGALRGERLSAGTLGYVCSGDMDEQAMHRFRPMAARRVAVGGDEHFSPQQVEQAEALCLESVASLRWPDWRTWAY